MLLPNLYFRKLSIFFAPFFFIPSLRLSSNQLIFAEQIAFWQAYSIAVNACVGLISWYTYYVLGGIKRAANFTAILAGLYSVFYGILTKEDLNLLLGAVFCFVLLACVMIMTRKVDWYKIA